jgi:hypothetical protein
MTLLQKEWPFDLATSAGIDVPCRYRRLAIVAAQGIDA